MAVLIKDTRKLLLLWGLILQFFGHDCGRTLVMTMLAGQLFGLSVCPSVSPQLWSRVKYPNKYWMDGWQWSLVQTFMFPTDRIIMTKVCETLTFYVVQSFHLSIKIPQLLMNGLTQNMAQTFLVPRWCMFEWHWWLLGRSEMSWNVHDRQRTNCNNLMSWFFI